MALFAYQVLQALGSGQPSMYAILMAVGKEGILTLINRRIVIGFQAILQVTVLCHEFGHGTMARYLGGSISYILLWPFGGELLTPNVFLHGNGIASGICFSSYPRQGTVKENLLKDLEVN